MALLVLDVAPRLRVEERPRAREPELAQCSIPSWMSSTQAPMYAEPMLLMIRSSAASITLATQKNSAWQSCVTTVGCRTPRIVFTVSVCVTSSQSGSTSAQSEWFLSKSSFAFSTCRFACRLQKKLISGPRFVDGASGWSGRTSVS